MIPVFQFHIAFVLKKYSFLSIGKHHQYTEAIDEEELIKSFDRLQQLIAGNSQMVLVLSGVFIEHLENKNPALVKTIQTAIKNKTVILVGTTYHCSLASLYSPGLFKEQIKMHRAIAKKVFDCTPEIFYNTANLYFDKLAALYSELGIASVIAPISEWHLNGRAANQLFKGKDDINLILLEDADTAVQDNVMGALDESVLKALSDKASIEKYRVPQPIYNKKLVIGKTLSSNALQNAIHQKIIYLRKRIKKQERKGLYAALSVFTSLDFFDMLTKTDDQNNTTPYDQYTNLMNALTDFELANKV